MVSSTRRTRSAFDAHLRHPSRTLQGSLIQSIVLLHHNEQLVAKRTQHFHSWSSCQHLALPRFLAPFCPLLLQCSSPYVCSYQDLEGKSPEEIATDRLTWKMRKRAVKQAIEVAACVVLLCCLNCNGCVLAREDQK